MKKYQNNSKKIQNNKYAIREKNLNPASLYHESNFKPTQLLFKHLITKYMQILVNPFPADNIPIVLFNYYYT